MRPSEHEKYLLADSLVHAACPPSNLEVTCQWNEHFM